ncbi:MAG TPA: hypothetical protein VF553_08720 [Pyrinomonadaceae bacterium]|jgi:hypothetical protein
MRPSSNASKLTSLLALLLTACFLLACSLTKMLTQSDMFEGTAMVDAAAAFKKKLGGPIKALSLEIEKDSVTLRAQDPNNREHVDEYKYVKGFVTGPNPVQLNSLERNLDNTLFDLDTVNLEATPELAKAAVSRTNLEGGKVTKMVIERSLGMSAGSLVKSGELQWTVSVEGSRESASVIANAKGEVKGVDLSQTSRAANVNFYEGNAMQEAAPKIKEGFGGRVRVLELIVYEKYVWFKAQDPQKPDEYNQYKYDINGLTRSGALGDAQMRMTLGPGSQKLKPEDFLFDLDEVDFSKTAELGETALEKLQINNGHIALMKISRGNWTEIRTDKEIKWEVSVTGARQNSGYVIFDAKGNLKKTKPPG